MEGAELGGYPIKKGTQVIIPLYAIHRDPKYWPDPETYDPERSEFEWPSFFPYRSKHCNRAKDGWIPNKTFKISHDARALMTRDSSCNQTKQNTFWCCGHALLYADFFLFF